MEQKIIKLKIKARHLLATKDFYSSKCAIGRAYREQMHEKKYRKIGISAIFGDELGGSYLRDKLYTIKKYDEDKYKRDRKKAEKAKSKSKIIRIIKLIPPHEIS